MQAIDTDGLPAELVVWGKLVAASDRVGQVSQPGVAGVQSGEGGQRDAGQVQAGERGQVAELVGHDGQLVAAWVEHGEGGQVAERFRQAGQLVAA